MSDKPEISTAYPDAPNPYSDTLPKRTPEQTILMTAAAVDKAQATGVKTTREAPINETGGPVTEGQNPNITSTERTAAKSSVAAPEKMTYSDTADHLSGLASGADKGRFNKDTYARAMAFVGLKSPTVEAPAAEKTAPVAVAAAPTKPITQIETVIELKDAPAPVVTMTPKPVAQSIPQPPVAERPIVVAQAPAPVKPVQAAAQPNNCVNSPATRMKQDPMMGNDEISRMGRWVGMLTGERDQFGVLKQPKTTNTGGVNCAAPTRPKQP